MITIDPLQFIAVAFMACGLLAVILEIAIRNPRDLLDLVDDVRAFAERPKSAGTLGHLKGAKPRDPRVSA
jgi:hypothetical protein